MGLTRKKYVLDKKFQINISLKAIILPLITTLTLSGVLLFFSNKNNILIESNNRNILEIIENQDQMIDMFLSTPALQQSDNPAIQTGVKTFRQNIGQLKKINDNSVEITRNSSRVFYFLIIMTVVQTAIIFAMFIFYTHKVSGPAHVMMNQMKQIRENKEIKKRPLRKNDHLKELYDDLWETIEYLAKKKN